MPTDDTGVTDLLRRASDGLTPDVDRLVHGGITRGRSRQRRARIGTAVASLAVIGVIGTLAAVVPHLGDPDSTSSEVATEPTPTGTPTDPAPTDPAPTETPTETPSPTEGPPPAVPVSLGLPAAEVPGTVERILALDGRVSAPAVQTDAREEKFVQFLVDGMATDVGMEVDARGGRERCEQDAQRLGGACEEVAYGGWLLSWGPTLADGVTCAGANLWRYGFQVWATSCNAPEGKDVPVLASEPALDRAQLRTVVTTHAWFG